MEEKKLDIAKQVYILFGLVLFAFVNVFLFDKKEGIGFSVFSTLTLLTIGLLSHRTLLRVLGILSYVINVVAALLGLNYLGWLTGVQAIELIFVVWYLYPKDTFLKTDTTDKFTYRYRWQQVLKVILITVAIYVAYKIASVLWEGSFLEFGGNTAFIFGIQYFLYISLVKARAHEQSEVEKLETASKTLEELKASMAANPLTPAKKPMMSHMAANTFVKFAGIWLIVMDLSILSYIIRPNDLGFGVGAFFVLLSIVISLVVKTTEDTTDVFSVIYHKMRPVQPVFFMILLIAHAHKFSYGAAYALLFAVAYFIWAINKINMKTLLALTILIYFLPVFGYISNPYRLGAKNLNEAVKLITGTGDVNYFHLGDWLPSPSDSFDDEDDYDDYDSYDKESLEKEAAAFSEEITFSTTSYADYSGIWNGEDFDLTLTYSSIDKALKITAYGTDDELLLKDFDKEYDSMKNLSPNDNDKRYLDYYLVGNIKSDYGTYSIYLEMTDDWIQAYKASPSSVSYKLLIVGSDNTPEKALSETL